MGDKREPYTYFNQVMHVDNQSAWLYGESQAPQSANPQFAWRYDLKRAGYMERLLIDPNSSNKLGRRTGNFQPNDDWFKFPMEVGKEWTVKVTWNNGQGHDDYKAKVEAFEKIKVQAGEFDAYKVVFKGYWNQATGGNGRTEQVTWYAPQAKREVKRTYENRTPGGQRWNHEETELTKWEPKAALGNYPVVGLRAEGAPAGAAAVPAVPASTASAPR